MWWHTFNSRAQVIEGDRSLSVRQHWTIQPVLGKLGLHSKTTSKKKKNHHVTKLIQPHLESVQDLVFTLV